MSSRRLPLVAAVAAVSLLAPSLADAEWGPPRAVTGTGDDAYTLGVAANAQDRPSVLFQNRTRRGRWTLALRRADGSGRLGRSTVVLRGSHQVEGAGLFAGPGRDLVAGWLEIVNRSRRPVVATGSRLQHRQVLAPGPRSTQVLRMAANRRGDAIVAFWRYAGGTYPNFAIYASIRRAGGRFGTPQPVVTANVGNPAVAIDQRGNAVVAWTDRAGVHLAGRRAGAGSFDAPVLVAPADHPEGEVGVGIDGDHVVAAWTTEDLDGNRTMLVSERTAGTSFRAPVALSSPAARIPHYPTPSVVVTGSRVLVAWVQGKPFTSADDAAALSVKRHDGSWSAPVLRGVRGPARVYFADLLGPAPGRPPVLGLTVSHGNALTAATTTVRPSDGLGRVLAPRTGRGGAFRPLMAQGRRHTWLATERIVGFRHRVPRKQVLLFRSN